MKSWPQNLTIWHNYFLGVNKVVSTVASGILFACFFYSRRKYQDCFLLWPHSCSSKKKFQSRTKVYFLGVGLLLSSHSFTKIHCQPHTMSQYRSTVAHWYAICVVPGGPRFKFWQGRELLILNIFWIPGKTEMKEENTFENFCRKMSVLETTAQCVRDKMH